MRLAHVTATFPPYQGGEGNVCFYTARELARRGHQVTVFTVETGEDFDYPQEINICRLPPLITIGNASFLPGLLQINQFDIIHLHHPFIFGAELIWTVSKLRGIPYIITHHNDLIGNGLRYYLFKAYSVFSTRLVFSGSKKFAVVSLDHAKNCLITPRLRNRWLDVVEVPNGVDADTFRPGLDGASLRRANGISEEEKVVLFVGTLDRAHHYRRVDKLIEAIRILEDRNLYLWIVGDGDQRIIYQKLAIESGMNENIHFLGRVDHQHLPDVYAAADIVVLPSQIQESFGIVLIEAMACGKPVLASNLPGIRTVLTDGWDGFLVKAGEAIDLAKKIRQLLDDPSLRRVMGQRGRAKIEAKYTWSKVVDRLECIYATVMENMGCTCE